MPLTARLNGEPIYAFELDDDAAKALTARVKRGEATLAMACGRPGFLRRSKIGTRHFFHGRAAEVCDWPHGSMTEQHMTAQRIIITAARAAGWDAVDEVAGNGWRADVLATRGRTRIAIEVQWSRQADYRYDERQEAYEVDGVRAAWFSRGHGSNPDELFVPRREVPIFRLSEAQPFTVRIGGSPALPLDEAVTGLLRGRWRFKAKSPTVIASRVIVVTTTCYHCKGSMTVHGVESIGEQTTCPDTSKRVQTYDPLSWGLPNSLEANTRDHPLLAAAIREKRLPPLAPIRVRNTKENATFSTHMYGCPHCPRANASPEITKRLRRLRLDPRAEFVIERESELESPHWCSHRHLG